MKAVERVTSDNIKQFAKEVLVPGQTIHNDALAALKVLAEDYHHVTKNIPPEQANEWLPWVHVVISHYKTHILGTCHGVSGRYLQEYIDQFCYRLNRRFREEQRPNRLVTLCVCRSPVLVEPVAY